MFEGAAALRQVKMDRNNNIIHFILNLSEMQGFRQILTPF
jgi:hypothetical protein